MAKPIPMKIDFVSDVSCPWCVIGLKALDQALANVTSDISAEIHFQPFEAAYQSGLLTLPAPADSVASG